MANKQTDNEVVEKRFVFKCMLTEADRIRTRVSAECFKRSLPAEFETIGGAFKERHYGLKVEGTKEQLNDFSEWWEASIEDLVEPRTLLGCLVKEHL